MNKKKKLKIHLYLISKNCAKIKSGLVFQLRIHCYNYKLLYRIPTATKKKTPIKGTQKKMRK